MGRSLYAPNGAHKKLGAPVPKHDMMTMDPNRQDFTSFLIFCTRLLWFTGAKLLGTIVTNKSCAARGIQVIAPHLTPARSAGSASFAVVVAVKGPKRMDNGG